jgi:hypothetical protein
MYVCVNELGGLVTFCLEEETKIRNAWLHAFKGYLTLNVRSVTHAVKTDLMIIPGSTGEI